MYGYLIVFDGWFARLTLTVCLQLKFNILAPALPIQDIYMVNLLIEFGVNINYDCPDVSHVFFCIVHVCHPTHLDYC